MDGENANVDDEIDETMREGFDDDDNIEENEMYPDNGDDEDEDEDNDDDNGAIEDEEETGIGEKTRNFEDNEEDDDDDDNDDGENKDGVENDNRNNDEGQDDGDEEDDIDDEEDEDETEGNNGPSEKGNNMENVLIGGTIPKEALCILDGFIESDDKMLERVTLYIKRLPATIGRSHITTDKNFVGLSGGNSINNNNNSSPNGKNANNKAVSRQHVRIDYRVPTSAGGCGHIQTKVGFRSEFFYNHTDEPIATTDIRILKLTSTDAKNTSSVLPMKGFYTLTCLGKNRVLVNGTRIEPNETVWIQSGTAIRIAGYLLYFLTPTKTNDMVQKTLQIRDDVAPTIKKRKLSLGVSTAQPAIIGSGTGEGIMATGDDDNDDDKNDSNLHTGSFRGSASRSMQSEIESLSTEKLLHEMQAANDADIWERRHQLIGSTLSYRAVVEATHDTEWYEREGGTVSRSAVMEWVASSEKFGEWVEHMLSKIEQKSYQASITKGMIKAGYIRTTSSGRYIKWIVPRPGQSKDKTTRSVLDESSRTNVQESEQSD